MADTAIATAGKGYIENRKQELAGEKPVRWGHLVGGVAAIIISSAGFSLAGNCNEWKSGGKTAWLVTLFVLGLLVSIFFFLSAFEKPIIDWVSTWGKPKNA